MEDARLPTVTVITAAWNALQPLKATVQSVREQSFGGVEHIVVDGASTDGTPSWLRGQEGVRSLSEPDDGISGALNKALAMARGQWVLVLGAGDTFTTRTALESAVQELTTDVDILSCSVRFMREDSQLLNRSRGFTLKTYFKTTIPHQGALCRRDLFDWVGGFDTSLKVCMDYDWFLSARDAGASVHVSSTVLTDMPDTGISSSLEWLDLRARFAEERHIHLNHVRSPAWRLVYALYWPLYLQYRRVRQRLFSAS